MRFVVNVLIALMLLGILTGVVVMRDIQHQHQAALDQAQHDLRRLQREVMLQASLRQVEMSETGYPLTIDPAWFEDNLPRNDLIGPAHPWVEIAHEDHRRLDHPTVKIAAEKDVARFWYNPYTGRVRARVPTATSDATALKTYNYINNVNLNSLFDDAGNGR